MNVLSLFDGMSCAQIALERADIKVDNYYASEIDKHAIQVAQHNYPNTIQLGDIKNVSKEKVPNIDLLIGGSPCQSLSLASHNPNSGLTHGKSVLFWEYIRVLEEVRPTYFILENVASMKSSDKEIISQTLGVQPIMINSALVSAQSRKRLYWTNIPNVQQPQDKQIFLKDVIEHGDTERLKSYCLVATYSRAYPRDYLVDKKRQMIFNKPIRIGTIGNGGQGERIYHVDGKSITLSTSSGGRGANTGLYEIGKYLRKLTPVECERLQTVPENYTSIVSQAQRYKMLGNGFTVDVIAHILGYLNENRIRN